MPGQGGWTPSARQNSDVRNQVGGEAAGIDGAAFLIDLQSVMLAHVAEVGRIDALNGIALHRRAADGLFRQFQSFPAGGNRACTE